MEANGSTIEETIKDFCRRGFSKAETARILGFHLRKFMTILEYMEPLDWPKNGMSQGNKEARDRQKGVYYPKRAEAIAKAQAVRAATCVHTAFGITDTFTHLYERFSVPLGLKFTTVKNRYYCQGWPLELALTSPKIRPYTYNKRERDPQTNQFLKVIRHDP